ncbi:Cyclin, N-terminal domain containing protein [Brugia malayi]|uniref:Cyclin N-terminal domain-containing protein n=2 Tax=Brugia TaxID=6278 RepID=A0A4E9FDU7_BRUMA|nr:Cyclin, N-terminal domain containing protein [Brugia malayi]VIO95075.1 Cyclin, N-terminal domain containing protein [Brugia malayi]
MENFRCTEFLTESPSTSSAPGRFGGITATTIAPPATSAPPPPIVTRSLNSASTSAPSSRQQQQQQTQQLRRRATKSDVGLRQSSPNDVMKLLLGQIPVSRKRSTTDRLNIAQWPSVLPLADKTVHCDDRCLESMFKAQSMKPMHGNCFLSVQMDVTAHHRQQVIEWIYDVCKEEYCEPDVFLLAVSLVDRFLSVQSFHRNNLQALAGACLFVSSKVKAPQPLNAERIAYYTDGAVRMDQILQGELLVLNKLNWDVSTSTALDFLDQVAARYGDLHPLSEDSRIAAHRIQMG